MLLALFWKKMVSILVKIEKSNNDDFTVGRNLLKMIMIRYR